MTNHQLDKGDLRILATEEGHLRDLSRLLCEGFHISESQRPNYTPAVLRWKYFDSRGPWVGPRSLIVQGEGRVSAHIGVTTTEFVSTHDEALKVPAVFPVDWISTQQGGMLGAMLMLKAFGGGSVQYSYGSTESGQKVLLGCGFKKICAIPIFHKVFHPANFAAWRLIHGPQKLPKGAALLAVDMFRSVFHPGLKDSSIDLNIELVEKFPEEISKLFVRSQHKFIGTSRTPELLNYFLRMPGGRFSGWLFRIGGQLAGFALTSVVKRGEIRIGKIVDFFLVDADVAVWQIVIQALTGKLADAGSDLAQVMATADWFQDALRANGYFPRGGGAFFLRDLQNLIPLNIPFHLTLLDGDQAY